MYGINSVGGLVGQSNGNISDSHATGNVTGYTAWVGGLVGTNSGHISNSYASGDVSGWQYVGGLVGFNLHAGTIINNSTLDALHSCSYATGDVSAQGFVGGLIG